MRTESPTIFTQSAIAQTMMVKLNELPLEQQQEVLNFVEFLAQKNTLKYTIDLPNGLAQQLEQYLQEHPSETLDRIVAEALENKFAAKNLAPLLALAGIVTEAPKRASDRAEDASAIIQEC